MPLTKTLLLPIDITKRRYIMPQFRKDYITGTWVVIALERGQRPQDITEED